MVFYAKVVVPQYALKGFQRVSLWPGEVKKVTFEITPELMQIVNDLGERVIEKGVFKIMIGGSLPSQRSLDLGASQWSEAGFVVK